MDVFEDHLREAMLQLEHSKSSGVPKHDAE
jgi:hypothetical protein